MRTVRSHFSLSVLLCLAAGPALSQQRVPATPLITHDPYFSIWSTTDNLTDSDTTHWTGTAQPLSGVARIDGKPFRFMGRNPEEIPAMQQTDRIIGPTHTRYRFRADGVEIDLAFFSPVMPDNLDVYSRPVTYLTWSAQSIDAASHRVSILLDADPVIAVNDRSERVVSFR